MCYDTPQDETDWDKKVRENRGHRKTAVKYLSANDPESRCAVLRVVQEPFRIYMKYLLYVGGENFERRQQQREAAAKVAGIPTRVRTYRVLIAAKGKLEAANLSCCAIWTP